MNSNSRLEKPDVLIAGAGMAGLALAAALADSEVSVLLIDPQMPPSPDQWPDAFDPRVSALTHASENILRKLGVWDDMAQYRISPFAHMDVWDRDGTGNIQFHARDVGEEHVGHIVENRITTHCLLQRVQAADNIEIRQQGLQKILERDQADGWLVVLEDGAELQPAILVGADGGRSRVRDQLGFRCRTWDYGQQAIVTTVKTEQPHQCTARQVFLESGPLAFLPLQEGAGNHHRSCISSIVWTLGHEQSKALTEMDDAAFCSQLTQAFEHRLGAVLSVDRRFRFPLIQNHAVYYAMPGVALIGDAAHSLHPLAGQGINLGFLDAAVLAEEIHRAAENQLPMQDFSILRRYQRRRKPHNLLMMSAMEGFKQLFGADLAPLRVLRNRGMSLFNQHGHLKNHIMMRAMGMEGDLPVLAQPGLIADF
ncbi:MAG: 2-octaprenyl-3-methyl-6-methoxy-1,4-benzoquinol hydroxylase [Ketobacter sp.]|nr:MAG: 2-octaprenyl-3-methyl-6-methoxy-1,4-benzoquinol hydroxylase [Ketobacter sp.]